MYLGTQRIIQRNTITDILMKQSIHIDCPYCQRDDLVKNGHSENGTQRYRCNSCKRSFQWEYTYPAWLPGTKEQIETQTLNGSGVRDISRNLGIAKNTVIAELKKKRLSKSTRLSQNA
jgi:transposase